MQQDFMRLIAATSLLVLIGTMPAPAAELPSRKPGLWQVKTSIENSNAPARAIQQCIDATTDQETTSQQIDGTEVKLTRLVRKDGTEPNPSGSPAPLSSPGVQQVVGNDDVFAHTHALEDGGFLEGAHHAGTGHDVRC